MNPCCKTNFGKSEDNQWNFIFRVPSHLFIDDSASGSGSHIMPGIGRRSTPSRYSTLMWNIVQNKQTSSTFFLEIQSCEKIRFSYGNIRFGDPWIRFDYFHPDVCTYVRRHVWNNFVLTGSIPKKAAPRCIAAVELFKFSQRVTVAWYFTTFNIYSRSYWKCWNLQSIVINGKFEKSFSRLWYI